MVTAVLAVGLVITPGLYAYFASRKLLRYLDDPLFAERLAANMSRIASAAGISMGLTLVSMGPHRLLVIHVMLLGCILGWFPTRRKIFDESWSVLGFLAHATRFWLAYLGGFWLIAVLPWAARSSLPLAIAIGVAALVWNVSSARAVPWILGARPLDRSDLEDAFDAVVSRSTCGTPAFYRIDVPGGRFVNAMAVPSLHQSAVLFSDSLLNAMTRDETSAVFAHELAHLEHHTRVKLFAGYASFALLAAIPILVWTSPVSTHVVGWEWVWPVLLFFFLLYAARQHRSHETESDVRAAELCGDPEALVSALTKIHTLRHLPRRWSDHFEQASTHPSLARRIQAIRRAAGNGPEPAPIDVTLVVSPMLPRKAVVLDSERLHWLHGFSDAAHARANAEELLAEADERRSLPYGELRELQLEGRGSTQQLSFRDQTGESKTMPVAAEDVGRLQAALDRLDSRLGYAAEAIPSTGRWWSFVVAIFGLTTSVPLLFLGALALAAPSQASLAAAGIVAVATVAFELVRPSGWESVLTNVNAGVFPSLCLGYAGLACLHLAWKRHRLKMAQSRWTVGLAVAIPVLFTMGSLVTSLVTLRWDDISMGFHLWARHQPNVITYTLTLAAVLFTVRNRATRSTAAVVVVAAGVFIFAGTRQFRSGFTRGPFAGPIEDLVVQDADLTPVREIALAVDPDDLLDVYLSPAGSRLAYEHMPTTNPYDSNTLSAYSIEGMTGDFVTVEALAFGFIDETRWALVHFDPQGLVIEEMALDGSRRTVASGIPPVQSLTFWVDGALGRWRLEGLETEPSELVVVTGSFDSEKTEVLRFPFDAESTPGYGVVTADGGVLHATYEVSDLQRRFDMLALVPWLLYASGPPMLTASMHLGITTPDGVVERLATVPKLVSCLDRRPGDPLVYCIGYDTESTELWSFASEAHDFEAVGALPRVFYQGEVISDTEILLSAAHRLVIVRPSSKTAVRLRVPGMDETTEWFAISSHAGKLAVTGTDDESGSSKITVYELSSTEP